MTRRSTDYDVAQRSRCLTEYSVPVLVAGALALSALLWLAIYAVI
ncbi:hypothetical protein [Ruegeria arenilitoris]|nr:hypothetical protein [Ruegeria arenilitoris]